MSSTVPGKRFPSFTGLLEYLQQNGFRVEVGHYLRVQLLLDKLDGHYEPADLKTILCPLFASSRDEQLHFYDLFDGYLGYEEERLHRNHDNRAGRADVKDISRRFNGLMALLVLLAAVVFVIALSLRNGGGDSVPTASPVPTATINQTPSNTPDGSTPSVSPSATETITPAQMPIETPPPQSPRSQNFRPLIYLSALVVGLLVFTLYEFLLRRRRRLLLDKQHDKKPPSSWPLRVSLPGRELYGSVDYYQAIRRMRLRQADVSHRLHIGETIAATIKKLGYPSFRYRAESKPPEYLILIDRASPDDHQAALFNQLFKALTNEGVFAVRYFYEGDPRLCYDESGRERRHLIELRGKYAGHRLLIFGGGERFTDPVTGELASWCLPLFSAWKERALLTPMSPLQWSHREKKLADQFLLVPATSSGLRALIPRFASRLAGQRRGCLEDALLPALPQFVGTDPTTALRNYLGERGFQWLCACALHGQLHWGLTLRLGVLSALGPNLVTERTLLRLVRLPWFRRATLPDQLRRRLVDSLDTEVEKEARILLTEELKKEDPPPDTFAAAARRLEVGLNQWLLLPDPENLRHVKLALADVPPGDVLQDRVLTHSLQQLPAAFWINWLPRRLFQNSIPSFGLKNFVRLITVLCFMALIFVGLWAEYLRPGPMIISVPASSPTPTGSNCKGLPMHKNVWESVINRGYLIMGVQASAPPMNDSPNREKWDEEKGAADEEERRQKELSWRRKGFDYELARMIALEMGLVGRDNIKAREVSAFNDLFCLLNRQEPDGSFSVDIIMSGIAREPAYDDTISWSKSYAEFGYSLVTKKSSYIQTLDDCKNKKIGIVRGDNIVKAYVTSQLQDSEIVELPDESDEWLSDALNLNQVDAVVYDYPFAVEELKGINEQVKEQGVLGKLLEIRIASLPNGDLKYSIGVPKGEDELLGKINDAIDRVTSDGNARYAALIQKYFQSQDITPVQITSQEKVYIVKAGDSLSKIAADVLGNGGRWKELSELNNIANYLIFPGQKLILPK